jgi:hypothetical protein
VMLVSMSPELQRQQAYGCLYYNYASQKVVWWGL